MMPPISRDAALECAGNGRVFLIPQVSGAQWELGAVSTAKWTGVPLIDVLALTGLTSSAVEIIFEGADHGHAREQLTLTHIFPRSRVVVIKSGLGSHFPLTSPAIPAQNRRSHEMWVRVRQEQAGP
jgi:DMSO/TMAO reductase YedYZ molybdopterin-dependent catalytic subunit